MIWCDDVERWLNDGMPPRGEGAARTHARGCAACARTIDAAVALDAMLAAAATTAPAGFTDGVMARIDLEMEEARAPHGIAAIAAAPARATRPATSPPWWLAFAAEPAAAVALVMVPAVAAIALFVPSARDFVAAAARVAFSSSLTATLNGTTAAVTDANALFNAMNPTARLLLAVGFVSVTLWSAIAVPTWLGPILIPRRGSLPRSRS